MRGFPDPSRARLSGANLREANLGKANLSGATLSEAQNLTEEQINGAIGDAATKLPDHIQRRPAHWSKEVLVGERRLKRLPDEVESEES